MFPGVVDETEHVVIIEGIEGLTTRAPHAHETRAAQETQLMGHGRLGQAHKRRQITHTPFAVAERTNEADPRGIAQQLEHVGHRTHGVGGQQATLHVGQRVGGGCVDGFTSLGVTNRVGGSGVNGGLHRSMNI